MTYQNVTGTLNPGGHPGSYNGQDAYNDMLIVEEHNAIQNDLLLWGGVKRHRLSIAHTTKEPAHETERSVRYWQKNRFT